MSFSEPPLHLQPEVSRYLSAFILTSHALASLLVLVAPHIPMWLRVMLLAAISGSLYYYWCLHISRTHALAVLEATFYSVDNWRIQTPKGGKFANLCDSSFIHPWVCILNLRAEQTKQIYTLIVLNDNVPPETLRRLRVRLKFSAAS